MYLNDLIDYLFLVAAMVVVCVLNEKIKPK